MATTSQRPPSGSGVASSTAGWYVPVVGDAAYFPTKAAANAAWKLPDNQVEAGPFATQAAANAWISAHQASTGDAIKLGLGAGASSGLSDLTGGLIPNLHNLRELVIRILKVGAGLALMIIGLVQLTGATKVIPVAAKGLIIP